MSKEDQNWQQNSLPLIQSIHEELGLKVYNLSAQYSDQ